MLGTVLNSEDTVVDETKSPHSCSLRSRGEKGSKQVITRYSVRRLDVKSGTAGMATLIVGGVAAEDKVVKDDL